MKKQLLDEPETVSTIDTGHNYLTNVACLSDEEIWTSGDDNTMKLFSTNQGSLLKSITTKSENWPYDIAVTKSGDLVYTDISDRTVNILKNEKIEEVIRLRISEPFAVCSTSSGDLLVITHSDDKQQSKVSRYRGSTQKQIIELDISRKYMFSAIKRYLFPTRLTNYICENRNLDICVSSKEAGAVVVVNQK
ncbi:uncharacterized protein LOC134265983 [Saccostrea cucullata]|uniref:uncharacterized protein LOC134265983 n=1 Tax=Saccostrea cuccullata TaxID=36930 RepID=UPI002ED34956